MLFDYQLDRHCSKNAGAGPTSCRQFDYQLDRHCSKTQERRLHGRTGLITS